MGGIDVGGALYDLGKRGVDKHILESYKQEHLREGEAAWNAYVFGDFTQENIAARIGTGKDTLVFGESEDAKWTADTVQNGIGGRTITMRDAGNSYNNAIQLGHEAHRDGINGPDNYLETRSAVTGHTEMAISMLKDGQGLSMSANLQNDIGAYMIGQDVFNAYVDGSYDSSGDYWKLTADGGLEYDGEGYLRGVNGEYIRDKDGNKIGADGIEGGLITIMQKAGVNLTSEQAAQMLAEAGFQHTNPDSEDTSTWMWNITGEDGQQVNMGAVLSAAAFGEDSTYGAIATALQTGLNNRFVDWQTSWNGATDAQRAYFNGYSENSYQELFAYYNANDEVWAEGSPIAWFVNNTSEVTIGGRTFVTHNHSIPKFEQLAQTLTDEQFNYLMAGSVGSLNARFVRGSTEYLSDHAFGQAIDFYPDSNPFIINGNTSRETAAFNLMTAAANGTTTSIQDFDTFMAANSRLHAIRDMGNSNDFIDNFLATYAENQQTLNTLGQLINAGGPLDNWLINAYNSAQKYNTDYAGTYSLFNNLNTRNNPDDYDEYLRYSTWIDDGIVNLDPTYINALRQSGFDWGALYRNRIDGMHFYY